MKNNTPRRFKFGLVKPAEEFECSFDAAVVGANYGKLMRAAEDSGRITGRRPLRNIT